MQTRKIQQQLDNLWTVQDLTRLFNVSVQTIHVWRRDKRLPTVVIKSNERPAIRFVKQDVKSWASKQGIAMGAAA